MMWKGVGLGGRDQENPNSPINVSLTPLLFSQQNQIVQGNRKTSENKSESF